MERQKRVKELESQLADSERNQQKWEALSHRSSSNQTISSCDSSKRTPPVTSNHNRMLVCFCFCKQSYKFHVLSILRHGTICSNLIN
jgi:hypothetical protein